MTTFTIDAASFRKALDVVAGSTNDIVRAGKTCYIAVDGDSLMITGQSQGTVARATVQIDQYNESDPDFRPLVDYTRLAGIIDAVTGEVTVTIDDNVLDIAAESTSAKIALITENFFPEWKEAAPVASVMFGEFKDALNFVSPSVAASALGNHKLTGVSLKRDGEDLCLSTTDGVTAAFVKLTADWLVPTNLQVIVPHNDLKAAVSALNGTSDDLVISAADHVVELSTGLSSWLLRVIDGQFPDLVALKPKASEIVTQVTVGKRELLRSLKLASLFTSGNAAIQDNVRFTIEGDDLIVSNYGGERGSVADSITADVTGMEQEWILAGKNIQKLVTVGDEEITLSLVAPDKTVLVAPGGSERAFQLVTPCVPVQMA